MSASDATRVVGVYAYAGPGEVFRYEDACMVAGSEQQMRRYLTALRSDPAGHLSISKLRFGEIFDGLKSGGAYAFDRQAYARFYSLARRAGLDDLGGFPSDAAGAPGLLKVRLDQPERRA